jgi:hypothetical protein
MARDSRTETEAAGEIRRADPVLRRRAMLLIAAGAVIGALAILAFERYGLRIEERLLADSQAMDGHVLGAFIVIALTGVAPLVAFGIWSWRLGERIRTAGVFPPPGYRVIRDTQVIAGKAARTRGVVLRVVAAGLWTVGGMLCVVLWRMARWILESSA